MNTPALARIQVEILDDIRQRSMAFDDQLFAPRIGEIISVYDADSVKLPNFIPGLSGHFGMLDSILKRG
jgi:hypothetical protein